MNLNYYFLYIFRRRPSRYYNQKVNHLKASYADSEDENDPRRRRKFECGDSADSSELCYDYHPSSTSINTEQKSSNSSEDDKSTNHAPEKNNNKVDAIEEKAKKIADNEALKQARLEAKQKVCNFMNSRKMGLEKII